MVIRITAVMDSSQCPLLSRPAPTDVAQKAQRKPSDDYWVTGWVTRDARISRDAKHISTVVLCHLDNERFSGSEADG